MYKKNQLRLIGLGFIITLLIPFMAGTNAMGFSLEEIQQRLNDLTNQIRSGYQPPNNPSSTGSNTLDINPNETKVTQEISGQYSGVTLRCGAPDNCRFSLVIMEKQTVDGYTSYKSLRDSEVVNLSFGSSININVSNVKGSYILSLKNLNKLPMKIEYSVLRDSSSLVPNNTPTHNALPPNNSHIQSTDLGRIKFEVNNSHSFLVTPELKSGKYTFIIIPSDKRRNLTFIPEGINVRLSISVVNAQGRVIEVITSNRVGSFTIPNPLITHKGSSLKVDVNSEGSSKVYVIGV